MSQIQTSRKVGENGTCIIDELFNPIYLFTVITLPDTHRSNGPDKGGWERKVRNFPRIRTEVVDFPGKIWVDMTFGGEGWYRIGLKVSKE